MDSEQCIDYLNKLPKLDSFLQSIVEQYNKKDFITRKQLTFVREAISNHQRVSMFFETEKLMNDYERSLKDFFDTNGFLTKKQMSSLCI